MTVSRNTIRWRARSSPTAFPRDAQAGGAVPGSLIPSRAFADGGIHEAIEQYEDTIFYELLAEELALRDLDGQPLTRENYDALMARIDAYLSEFDEHGTDRVTVDLDEG